MMVAMLVLTEAASVERGTRLELVKATEVPTFMPNRRLVVLVAF